MVKLEKEILDKYATIVVERDAIFKRDGVDQVDATKKRRYDNGGYNERIVLWIPPKDCIRIEFEDEPQKNEGYITEIEAACKAKKIDYCITYHRGAKSPYVNIFNIDGIPVNEDNKIAKMLYVLQLLPSGAKKQLDRTNLGWTFSPVIGHPHWKSKYNGAIHKIVIGKNPIEHENKYPTHLLSELKKIKDKTQKSSYAAKEIAPWVEDFLLGYCCENILPAGQRHHVIEKNLAAYIIHRQDKEQIEDRYLKVQGRTTNTLRTWYSAILSGSFAEVSTGELYNYIKENELNFKIPKQTTQIENPFDIFEQNYQKNVLLFYSKQPFFYDKNKIFWFWNKEKSMYEIVDEVDIMVSLDKSLGFEGKTVNQKLKTHYIEAFKRVGRINLPEEPKQSWIQFKDAVFDLDGSVRKASPSYFFTNPIPWEFGDSEETPIMDKLFISWVGQKYVKTLYEIIAYCCYRSYPIQVLFSLCGSGRNGKTQYLKIIDKFFGKENSTSTELDLLMNNRFESFKLYKKLICLIGETNFGILKNSSILKKLTGGDKINFEKKNKDPFDDYNYSKIIIASNSLPSSEDTSDGFYRRWVIINFPNEFDESGKDIVDTIPEYEYKNLAYKITKILPELIKSGKITNQGSITSRKQKYIEMSNPMTFFIKQRCDTRDDYYEIYNKLYSEYVRYLLKNKKRRVNMREFKRALEEEGYYIDRTTREIKLDDQQYPQKLNGLFVVGLKLREDDLTIPSEKTLKNFEDVDIDDLERNILRYIEYHKLNNYVQAVSIFGDKAINSLISKGVIFENPAGTLKKV